MRRRLAVLAFGVLAVVTAGVALPVSSVAPETAAAVADGATTYDPSLRAGQCALLGRAFVPQLGCGRDGCVEGAVPWRKVPGAEACALPGQPRGFGYAATVDVRECRALQRRWVAEVNYCASQPDRTVAVVRDASQCTPPASVYVVLSEAAGRYDECLTTRRADSLSLQAAARGTTLAALLAQRQRGTEAGPGGLLMVGDSVSWRGADELARLDPALTVDGEPGRRPTELAARLRAYRARHGRPTGLLVELGTNRAPDFRRRDLADAVRSLPNAAPVMLVLPYVEIHGNRAAASPWSRRFGGWMRSVAAGRPGTCVADWPAYVRAHPGLLQDGIHPQNTAEGRWAHWILRQWARC
jgi:hypothetical protein